MRRKTLLTASVTCANWVKKYGLRFSEEPDVEAYDMLGSRTRPMAQTTGEAVDVIVPRLVAKELTIVGLLSKSNFMIRRHTEIG